MSEHPPWTGSDVIETWFRLIEQMLGGIQASDAHTLRPPSLRDACYAYALAKRTAVLTSEETIESFVNGLELGAMAALRKAWDFREVE